MGIIEKIESPPPIHVGCEVIIDTQSSLVHVTY